VGCTSIKVIRRNIALAQRGGHEAGAAGNHIGFVPVSEQGFGEGQSEASEMGNRIFGRSGDAIAEGDERADIDRFRQNANAAHIEALAGVMIDPFLGVIFTDPGDDSGRRLRLPDGYSDRSKKRIPTGDIEQRLTRWQDDILPGQLTSDDEAWCGALHSVDYTSEGTV
jgi:hypothetical protein